MTEEFDEDVFDADALIDESEWKPFPFRLKGEIHELPHAASLTARQQFAIDSGDFAEVLTEIAPEAADALLDAPGDVLLKVIEQWSAHAGIKPGESSASGSSSSATRRPSKRTSRGTTASRSRRR